MPVRYGVVLFLAVFSTACSGDTIESARRLVESEPAEAVELLKQADEERDSCFDCKIYLGLAYEKLGKLQEAADAYEGALSIEREGQRAETVRARLLAVYKRLFDAAADLAAKKDVAVKASPIEAELGVADPWANEYLASRYLAAFRDHARKNEYESALKSAEAVQSLYLDRAKKEKAARETTDYMKKHFVDTGILSLRRGVLEGLAAKGMYQASTDEIVLRYVLTIPDAGKDPFFDPTAADFKARVRTRACLPLRSILADIVEAVRPALGIGKPNDAELDRLFAKLYTYARAGFTSLGKDSWSRPAGKKFLCMVRVPLHAFLAELFRFSR